MNPMHSLKLQAVSLNLVACRLDRNLLIRAMLLVNLMGIATLSHAQTSVPSLLTDSTPTRSTTSFLRLDQTPTLDLLYMPSPYSYQNLGIFCKAEVQMDRWLPIPLMIRIGDVESAEELDGKGAYRGPH